MANHDPYHPWPDLPFDAWKDTCDTLHLWTQVIGKIALAQKPFLNEWWEVALHLTGRGLTTGLIPYQHRFFDMTFDFLGNALYIAVTDGRVSMIPLSPRSVAAFYGEVMGALRDLDIEVSINPLPSEIPHAVPFDQNTQDASYDAACALRWWRILCSTAGVLQRYRTPFTGKSSPINFFWGSFDLAETRFNGKPATVPQGMPRFFQIAEDQENITCGFWPGNTTAAGVTLGEPAYYSYIYPAPDGYKDAHVKPDAAHYDQTLGEFILPYSAVRTASDPAQTLLDFFQSTYEAAATLAGWDRTALERSR